MKLLSLIALIALCTACSSTGNVAKTDSEPQSTSQTEASKSQLPTNEVDFVKAIENMDRKAIIEALGEPVKAEDVRIKGTDRIVASIWYYEHLNTDADGVYYPLTELDFIDDKVVQVVFLNQADIEAEEKLGRSYELQKNKPKQ